jgi:hypothetical protein
MRPVGVISQNAVSVVRAFPASLIPGSPTSRLIRSACDLGRPYVPLRGRADPQHHSTRVATRDTGMFHGLWADKESPVPIGNFR